MREREPGRVRARAQKSEQNTRSKQEAEPKYHLRHRVRNEHGLQFHCLPPILALSFSMDVFSRIIQTKALRITLHFESGKRRCLSAANYVLTRRISLKDAVGVIIQKYFCIISYIQIICPAE